MLPTAKALQSMGAGTGTVLIHGAAPFAVIDIEPLRMHCVSISRIARGEIVTRFNHFPAEGSWYCRNCRLLTAARESERKRECRLHFLDC
jgi:hypothetical protein